MTPRSWRTCRQLILDDFSTLHHKLNPLKFGDVCQWIAADGDQIREFTFVDRADAILPSQHFRVTHCPGLNCSCRSHAGTFDEPFKLQRLDAVRERIAVHSTADENLETFCGHGR